MILSMGRKSTPLVGYLAHRCGGGLSRQQHDDREYPRIARRRIARLEKVYWRNSSGSLATVRRDPSRLIAGEQLKIVSPVFMLHNNLVDHFASARKHSGWD